MARFLASILLLLFFSCSSVNQANLNRVHIASEVGGYLLADLPLWANFSARAGCRRGNNMKYLHFGHLHRSFSLGQAKLIQLQLLYNRRYHLALSQFREKSPTPQMEERIFFEAKSEVDLGILSFASIQSPKVHLVWIDPAQNSPRYRKALSKLLNSDDFYRGHPVLISHCLNQKAMESFIRTLTQEDADFRFISAEMFSPFDSSWNLGSEFQISLGALFKGKQMILYRIGKQFVPGIKGRYKSVVFREP